jgi:hypothetical protein
MFSMLFDLGLGSIWKWEEVSMETVIGFGILFLILILPHWIAAKMLAPRPTAGRVIGAAFFQGLFAVAAFVGVLLLGIAFGQGMFLISGIFVIILSSLVSAGIYGFGFGRGLLYNILVVVAFIGITWTVNKLAEDGPLARLLKRPGDLKSAKTNTETPEAGKTETHYSTVQEAQAAAIQRYPDLGKAGTPFNQRFLEKHKRYQAETPDVLVASDWPMRIAAEVAGELGVP